MGLIMAACLPKLKTFCLNFQNYPPSFSHPSLIWTLLWCCRLLSCLAMAMAFACSVRPNLQTWRLSLAKLASPRGMLVVSLVPLKPWHPPFNGTVLIVPPLLKMLSFLRQATIHSPPRLLVTLSRRFEPLKPMSLLLTVKRQTSARNFSVESCSPTRTTMIPTRKRLKREIMFLIWLTRDWTVPSACSYQKGLSL